MKKLVHAYTGIDYKQYPAFINISQADDKYKIVIRSVESNDISEINLDAIELSHLANSILMFLGPEI